MNIIIAIVVCGIFTSVNSDCGSPKCGTQVVKDVLKNKTVIESIDIKLEVPKFEHINNIGIEDLNQVLLSLTKWFEEKINETNFHLSHFSNNSKIIVKSFYFNVDFEKGNAKIDVDLTEDENSVPEIVTPKVELEKKIATQLIIDIPETEPVSKTNVILSPMPVVLTTTTPTTTTKKKKINVLSKLIDNLDKVKDDELFNIMEFDTSYYDDNDDNSTDYPILDYIELYKDTTNEEVITTTKLPTIVDHLITKIYDKGITNVSQANMEPMPHVPVNRTWEEVAVADLTCYGGANCQKFAKAAFPWIVTIFITNDSKDSQFSYQCDGALISDKVIITDGRCMYKYNRTLEPENVLVFLGKANLQSFGDTEKVLKIKEIVLHPNFTVDSDGKASFDLALLIMEEPVEFNENIQSACIHQQDNVEEAATTAWSLTGSLIPIFFNKEKSPECYDKDDDVFCATYGNEVALCPSYGGIYASKQLNRWCLHGIFYGDPAERGICFSKDVFYTSLRPYMKWIIAVVDISNNYIM